MKPVAGTKVEFAGFTVSDKGLLPDDKKIAAIAEFPKPTNLTQLRSFLGLANQLGGFINNMAVLTEPLRGLLKKGVSFTWTADHDKVFFHLRTQLSSPQLVSFFNPSLETVLLSDASNLHGLGYALLQYTCLLYTSPSPRDRQKSRMPSSA